MYMISYASRFILRDKINFFFIAKMKSRTTPFVIIIVTCILGNLSLITGNPLPDFDTIFHRVANVSQSTSLDETVQKLDPETLFEDSVFLSAMNDIGVQTPYVILVLSTIQLKDGTLALNLTDSLKKLALKSASSSTTRGELLQLMVDSILLSDKGQNIDFLALDSNPHFKKIIKESGLPISFGTLSAIVNVDDVMKAIDIKGYFESALVSSNDNYMVVLQYVDYNEFVKQVKIENLAKNALVKTLAGGFGVSEKLLEMIGKIDSNELVKALDFNKIVAAAMKYTSSQNTDADITAYIKEIIGSIDAKSLANLLDYNQFFDGLLNQSQIVQYLQKVGITPSFIRSLLDNIKLNDLLTAMDFGKLLKFNGTSLIEFYQYVVRNLDLNRLLPDFKIHDLLRIPEIAKLLNQTKLDPDLVELVIESVKLNKFLMSFNVPSLIRDLRANKDKDYIKVLLNNTNIDQLLESVDVDKLFSHPQVADFIRTNLKMEPSLVKLLLKNFKVGDFLKQFDTKALSKLLVNSINGTVQAALEKMLNLVTIDEILQNINIKGFLEDPKVREILKSYGIDPIILEVSRSRSESRAFFFT